MVTKNKSSKHKSSKQIMESSEHGGGIKNGPKIKIDYLGNTNSNVICE
jgi:hypothetical protein